MSASFKKWYETATLEVHGIHTVSDMEKAYTAGLKWAAEIVMDFDHMSRMGGVVTSEMIAAAIRKEAGE